MASHENVTVNGIIIPTLVDNPSRQKIIETIQQRIQPNKKFVFVEVGSFLGGNFCAVVNEFINNPNFEPYSVDNWICHNVSKEHKEETETTEADFFEIFKENLRKTELYDKVKFYRGDSIEMSQKFEDESIDFIFLDGDHERNYVREELEVWLPKIKDNGVISGHDYADPGINQTVSLFFPSVETSSNYASYFYKRSLI